jgi:hypothetical protein
VKYSRSRGKKRRFLRSGRGIFIRCLAVLFFVGLCVSLARWISQKTNFSSAIEPSSAGFRSTDFISTQASTIQTRNKRLVYPFSVVPGGVASAQELQEVAAHDSVVAEHYSGFNYRKARLTAVEQPKLVYLSYRRGDHVYWTRKQASLHKGELLLTDGRITARTRCGNQVSVLPQADVSPNEPTMAELERPDAIASGIERNFPGQLSSHLLDIDPGLPLGPSSPGNSFAGVPQPGAFVPMPGGGVNGPVTTPGNGCPPNGTGTNCPPVNPPPGPPPTPVPEPATLLLTASGAAAVIARWRQHRSRAP